jgi:hypothetical protein
MPPLSGMIAGSLVILGLLLSMLVGMGFLILAGLGAFGPGILRELGWLRDQDEFQREAAYRAGYLAYLTGGFAAVLAISALRLRDANLEGPAGWIMLVLVILWTTWLFSSLLRYWGAKKTASRVLIVFGSFWVIFVIAAIIGEPPSTPLEAMLAMLMGSVVVVPFFVLAWTAGRRPRGTGAVLLVVAAFLFVLTFPTWLARSMESSAMLLTSALLLVPLIASGLALLREGSSDDEKGEEVG